MTSEESSTSEPESGDVDTGAPVRVLLVEDDPALRLVMRNLLEDNAYHVQEADSKDSAEAIFSSDDELAVVVLDLGLPPSPHTTSEGLATIRALTEHLHPAKIVVLTGQDEESAALAAVREGAFDFLAKPSASNDILHAVQRAALFYKNERTLAREEGLTRLQINARVADGLKAVREDAEERLVRQVLKDTEFNVYQSANKLGLKRESVYYFLKKFGIKRKDG
ncbi:MAG: response regulator [Pseudohongiellaceae bacterium]